MKKIVIGLTLTAVLVLAVASVAFAQEDSPVYPGGRGSGRMGGGMGGPADGSGVLHDYMTEALADALGITPEEFLVRREAGETLYDIALDLGLDIDAVREAMTQARTQAVEQAYADGALTQEQYELYLNAGGMGRMGGGQGGRGGRGGGYGGNCPYTSTDS